MAVTKEKSAAISISRKEYLGKKELKHGGKKVKEPITSW